jgi:hypothetical protein
VEYRKASMRGKDKKPVTPPPHLSAVNQQIFITKMLHELCWAQPTKSHMSASLRINDNHLKCEENEKIERSS